MCRDVVCFQGLLSPFARVGRKPGMIHHLKCEDPERSLLGEGSNTLLEVHLARAESYDNRIVVDTIWTRVIRKPVLRLGKRKSALRGSDGRMSVVDHPIRFFLPCHDEFGNISCGCLNSILLYPSAISAARTTSRVVVDDQVEPSGIYAPPTKRRETRIGMQCRVRCRRRRCSC
jgi:hypothetical protein